LAPRSTLAGGRQLALGRRAQLETRSTKEKVRLNGRAFFFWYLGGFDVSLPVATDGFRAIASVATRRT